MFKVGDLVTPNPDTFTPEIRTHISSLTGLRSFLVENTGKVFVVDRVPIGAICLKGVSGTYVDCYWKSAIPEIFKTIKKYDTNTGGDQG